MHSVYRLYLGQCVPSGLNADLLLMAPQVTVGATDPCRSPSIILFFPLYARICTYLPPPPPRDALEGKGPQRRSQQRLDRRLEEVAKAVGGGYCRLQMPLKLVLGVRGTVAGHRLRALEGGRGVPHFWNILPPGVASQLRQAPGRRKVVRQGAGQLEDELPETTTVFETPPDGLCLFHALARVWNEMHPQETRQTGQGMKRNLLDKMEETTGRTVEGHTRAQIIKEDGWAEAQEEDHRQGTQQTQQTPETRQKDGNTRRCDAEVCITPGAEPRYTCYGCGTWNHRQCASPGGDGGQLGVWLCVQCRMWKADFMSVGTVPGKGRVECLVCGEDVKTIGKYVRNAKQCICGGIVHHRCINQNTGALCECNLPQVLVHRFKKWQKSHNQATRQRRAAIVKQKREQVAAQDTWRPGTKVWLIGLRRAELNGAEGIVQGEENGRILVKLDHQKGGRTVAVTHDHLSGQPPGDASRRGSQEQASSLQTRRAGAQRHDNAPVTPPGHTAARHVEAAVLALVAGAAVVVVSSAGHFVTGSAMRLQGLRQMEFNACEAIVVGHDGFRVQVRITKGPQQTQGREIRVKRANVIRLERPTTNMAPQPQPQHKPQPVGANQPTVPHTRGRDPVADMPDTLPGNWYQVLGVRYPGATTEEIKRAYKRLSVKLHPDKNAHHKEKAEGLFKQIGKAKDGLLDTEARRRHDADIQRGDRRQQREVRHCNRGAATHDPGQEGRRPGEPNTLTMQRRFAYATVDFMEAQYKSIVRAREWQLARTPMPNMTRGEVWYLICPGLMMPVVRVRILAVGVYTPQCSCHPHGVCHTHGEWQPVVHIDGDLPGENVLVSQPGRLLPTDRLAQLIAAASRRR